MTRKQVRSSARASAKNVLGKNFKATLPALLVMLGVAAVTSIVSILGMYIDNPILYIWEMLLSITLTFAIIPIAYGFYMWAKKALSGADTNVRDIFSVYTDSKLLIRIVKQMLLIMGIIALIVICLISIIFILVIIFGTIMATSGIDMTRFMRMGYMDYMSSGMMRMMPLAILFIAILYIGFLCLITFFSVRLAASQYLLVTYPKMRVTDTLSRSFKMMKSHVWDYIILSISVMWPVLIAVILYSMFIGIVTALSYINGWYFLDIVRSISSIVFVAVTYCIMPYLYLTLTSYYNMLDYNYINTINAQNQSAKVNAAPEVETTNGNQQ